MDSEHCNALKYHQQEFSTTEGFHVLAKFPIYEETVTNNYSLGNIKLFGLLLLSDFLISSRFDFRALQSCCRQCDNGNDNDNDNDRERQRETERDSERQRETKRDR